MQNLEQIRARNAYEAATGTSYRGANDGEVVKKLPAYIRTNGILAAAAFASEKKSGYDGAFNAVIKHLYDRKIVMSNSLDEFLRELSSVSTTAEKLRSVTSEAMAYLNYLRRFAKKGK